MPKEMVDPDALGDLVSKVGLGGAVILIFTIGIAFNLHKIINALNGVLKTILKYMNDKNRIQSKVDQKQRNLKTAIGAAKRNGKKTSGAEE